MYTAETSDASTLLLAHYVEYMLYCILLHLPSIHFYLILLLIHLTALPITYLHDYIFIPSDLCMPLTDINNKTHIFGKTRFLGKCKTLINIVPLYLDCQQQS